MSYRWCLAKDHPGANSSGQVYEHILVVEKALGKYLPKGAIVHHVDGDGLNNNTDNLVICENRVYHALLHIRQDALEACGHANWRRCSFCQKYDDPENLYISPDGLQARHRECRNKYRRERRRERKNFIEITL